MPFTTSHLAAPRSLAAICAIALAASAIAAPPASAQEPTDPRVGLSAGWLDAGQTASNMELVAHRDKPAGWFNAAQPGSFAFANSDLAFRGNFVFQGGWRGFHVWDISNPSAPTIRTSFVCPGGQGDPSVYGNLLFISVEDLAGRVDCGTEPVRDSVSSDRFRGVRIFDISDIARPKQVAAVQTCRGSHTHTLVTDPDDSSRVWVYVSGTSIVRSPNELAGCSGLPPDQDPNTSYFRIEVIEVPLARPQDARVVNMPRLFADTSGAIAGLWKGGAHGEGTQTTSETNQCHDITVYPAIGLGAGACSGNGILIDISDPANPTRLDEVVDPNFAYWHSATFSNDGSTVLFTDEWGGGTQPRCRATDRPEWGADAIFALEDRQLRFASYFKIPAAQAATENCVAHNGSLVPVPGRDIMVQAWYQGGVSVVDFTDPSNPFEIAYFDRGPMSDSTLMLSGHWSAYWYNGLIVASEIGRGLDIFRLTPSEYLSENEIEAAKLVRFDQFNAQLQPKIEWPARFVVAHAYVDGLVREDGLRAAWAESVRRDLTRAEGLRGAAKQSVLRKLAQQLAQDAERAADSKRVRALADVVRRLAEN